MNKNTFQYLSYLSALPHAAYVVNEASEAKGMLGVRLYDKKIYVPLHHISAISQEINITPLVYTKPWFAGIVRHSGHFFSVIDLARFPEVSEVRHIPQSLIYLTGETGHYYAIIVHGIEETITLSEVPQRASIADTPYTEAYRFFYGEEPVQIFSLAKLLNSPWFSDISNYQ